MALPKSGDEKIFVPIVVVVPDSNSETEHRNREPGFLRHIRKCSIVIIAIELWRSCETGMSGPVLTVDDQNVLPAVVVVVNQSAPGPHGLGKIFFSECAVVVDETDARLRGDVAELDLGRSGDTGKKKQRKQPQKAHAEAQSQL